MGSVRKAAEDGSKNMPAAGQPWLGPLTFPTLGTSLPPSGPLPLYYEIPRAIILVSLLLIISGRVRPGYLPALLLEERDNTNGCLAKGI